MRHMNIPVITGPTATGKTSVAVALAKQINGEVVSADSMLVYQGMDIGTAKPTADEKQGIPHHMIDIIDPAEAFSAADYQRRAMKIIEDIHARGAVPIVAGGTGFYINALVYGNDFSQGPDDTQNRERLMQLEAEELHRLLQEADPASAAIIHTNNIKRAARALSFFQTTGQRLSEHNHEQKQNQPLYDTDFIILYCDRVPLYERIDRRVIDMVQQGLKEEVQGLLDKGCSPSLISMQGIGYKEMVRHIQGEYTLNDTVAAIQQATRHYAKRQLTWFKHQTKNGRWIDIKDKTAEEVIKSWKL